MSTYVLVAAVVIALVVAGVVIFRLTLTPPPPAVLVDFPPVGQTGKFAYFVGGDFEWNDGSYSNLEILSVNVNCSAWSHPANPEISSDTWSVRIDDRSKSVVAVGSAQNWVALRFDCVSPDTSYTLRPLVARVRFDYSGSIVSFDAVETTVTVQVPTPHNFDSPNAQLTDTEGKHYREGTHDHSAWDVEWQE